MTGARKKEDGLFAIMAEGLRQVSRIIVASIFPPIAEGVDTVLQTIDERIMRLEQRILQKAVSSSIIGLGIVFLLLALFFALKEFLGWSDAVASFFVGITILLIGLFLKVRAPGR